MSHVLLTLQYALQTIQKEITFCKKTKIKILGVIENMGSFACSCCNVRCWFTSSLTWQEVSALFGEGCGESLANEIGVPFLGSLPLDSVWLLDVEDL